MGTEIREGQELSPLVRGVTQEKINLYAHASGDYNPIHIDESFAAQTPLGGTIAHGMLVLAYISEMLSLNFGQAWGRSGKLSARFKAPARPGDTLTVSGRIDSVQGGQAGPNVGCSLECRNHKGEAVVTAEATVYPDRD
jgi:acyl dehydratase